MGRTGIPINRPQEVGNRGECGHEAFGNDGKLVVVDFGTSFETYYEVSGFTPAPMMIFHEKISV